MFLAPLCVHLLHCNDLGFEIAIHSILRNGAARLGRQLVFREWPRGLACRVSEQVDGDEGTQVRDNYTDTNYCETREPPDREEKVTELVLLKWGQLELIDQNNMHGTRKRRELD